MNVIVSNLNSKSFVNLDVDVIKTISGEFTVDEIVQSFSNFFFNRMFLDITAIKDYSDINNLKKLSVGLDVSKIILFISDDSVVNSESYISKLVSIGIYNFAKNESELKYLYDNPNSYRDVAHLQKVEETNLNFVESSSNDNNNDGSNSNSSNSIRVIGIKNFTSHAGATSLIYMLKKQLSKDFNVVAIEVNKGDFLFFNDKDMVSCKSTNISDYILRYKNVNIILIDLNDLDEVTSSNVCTDVIYLMESSTLMINKSLMLNNKEFLNLGSKNVVLNRSLLVPNDVKQLQREANINFFAVLPPMNDRVDNSSFLFPLLSKLGLYRMVN